MKNDTIIKALTEKNIPFKTDFPLAPKTTFKVGSTADLFITPQDIQQLATSLELLQQEDSDFFILGGGSNIVFPDQSFHKPVISTEFLNSIFMADSKAAAGESVKVVCQSGTSMAAFVNFCTKNNLTGAEVFAGLPGTVGGALFMNARCFNKSVSDLQPETEYIEVKDKELNDITHQFSQSEWDYKKSPLQNQTIAKKIILSGTFFLTKCDESEHERIEADCKKFIAERVDKGHFKYPSAGSVFKNNHDFGKPSGKIIDEAGLKGFAIGGAQIAPFHGNFIINVNNAKARDISDLVKHVQICVNEKFNFDLEPEIIFLNND